MQRLLACLVVIIFLTSGHGYAFTLNFFPPTVFSTDTATMDADLGIDGFTIEDFEDLEFIPDLTVSFSQGGAPTTIDQLASLFEGTTNLGDTTEAWDGRHTLANTVTNQLDPGPDRANRVVFELGQPALSVGVGLIGFQSLDPPSSTFPITDHRLLINGVVQTDSLEQLAGSAWQGSRLGRNVYLRIDAQDGEMIESFGFENITQTGTIDFLEFDRLAVSIPESTAAVLLGIGSMTLLGRRVGKRQSRSK